jgi:hypothetical protein
MAIPCKWRGSVHAPALTVTRFYPVPEYGTEVKPVVFPSRSALLLQDKRVFGATSTALWPARKRSSHLGQRWRCCSILEAFQPAIDFGRRHAFNHRDQQENNPDPSKGKMD